MKADTTAFTNVNVIPMKQSGVVEHQSVLVRGDTIIGMGSSHEVPIPEQATIIDGAGKYLLPGFCDMHVHIDFPTQLNGSRAWSEPSDDARAELKLYLINGVTTVRNMSGAPFHLVLQQEVEAGLTPGPRIRSTSPIIDGEPMAWPFCERAVSLDDAARLVDQIKDAGYQAIKVYNRVPLDVYDAFIRLGQKFDLPVVGHVPFPVGIKHALAVGQHSVEHFRGYDFFGSGDPESLSWQERAQTWLSLSEAQLEELIADTAKSESWNCPTFTVVKAGAEACVRAPQDLLPHEAYLPRSLKAVQLAALEAIQKDSRMAANLEQALLVQEGFLSAMARATSRLLIGTDAGILNIAPGFSLHDELENFVKAGLPPEFVLRCCCRHPALFFGHENREGCVAPGYAADLVLLDANPLADIRNTRRIAGVMSQGVWLARNALSAMA